MTTPCGGYYLGHPDHLIRIDGSHAGLSRSWQPRVSIHDGGLAPSFAFSHPQRRAAREWRIGLDACTPDEIAGVHELLMEPSALRVMVDPYAQVVNALPPEASMFIGSPNVGDPLQAGGGYGIAGGGHVSRHAINPSAQEGEEALVIAGTAPVLPGSTVTASAYVASRYGATVTVVWNSSAGNAIDYAVSAPAPVDVSRLHRVSVTAIAPAGAVAAAVHVRRAEYMARSALTWTDHVTEWGVGGTALRCVLTEVTDEVTHAVPDVPGLIRSNHALAVREVGV